VKAGFTVIEFIVVMAIIATLFGLGGVLLLSVQRQASITNTANKLVVDIKEQQLKAMVGDTGGSETASPSGIYFYPDKYILFRGDSFDSADPSNFVTNLDYGLQFSQINLFENQIKFTPGSGEILGFVSGSDNVVLKNTTNTDSKTVKINSLGVVVNMD
jgi:prepilin-type N-terminal cleavage/methylation domain-containing protein